MIRTLSSTANFFSGNGVSVEAMCAESHQYRPLLAVPNKRIAYSLV